MLYFFHLHEWRLPCNLISSRDPNYQPISGRATLIMSAGGSLWKLKEVSLSLATDGWMRRDELFCWRMKMFIASACAAARGSTIY